MIKKMCIALSLFMFFIFNSGHAQAPDFHSTEGMDCSQCHKCEKPSKADPCLKLCPRPFKEQDKGVKLSPQQIPDMVVLDDLENLYEPVRFSHKVHVNMVFMSGGSNGCVVCHHFTPTNQSHPPCKKCHDPNVLNENINQPGLKGAYHRQCIQCHREWSKETDCEVCHAMKAKKQEQGSAYKPHQYRQCNEPDKKVYQTAHGQGTYVTFFHNNHSRLYGLKCNSCHREDPCVACHYQGEKPLSVAEPHADVMHYKCSACHNITQSTGCSKCHSKTERAGFDHKQATGWALGVYHQKLSCQSCHPEGKTVAKLDRTCNGCHGNWNSENFNHAVTGIELDETHIAAECSDCHIERRFDKSPDCSGCHEGDKTYPKDKPGKVTKRGK